MRDSLTAALHDRHSCSLFLANQRIPEPDLVYVLDAGRLAPSAMGIEPWRFIVVEGAGLKAQLAHGADHGADKYRQPLDQLVEYR